MLANTHAYIVHMYVYVETNACMYVCMHLLNNKCAYNEGESKAMRPRCTCSTTENQLINRTAALATNARTTKIVKIIFTYTHMYL